MAAAPGPGGSRSPGGVTARGLRELVRDAGRISPDFKRAILHEIKDVADIVATEAQRIARIKGLRDTGRLIRTTRATVRAGRGLVRTSAVRRGFPYPAVHEFAGRGAREYGPRGYMNPALDRKREEVVEALGEIMDRVAARNGF